MMTLKYVVVRDSDGWYLGSVPSLPGCQAQARTPEALTERLREAARLYLDAVKREEPAEFLEVGELEV
jgi:predicted RNase H-like HicB family nuclease